MKRGFARAESKLQDFYPVSASDFLHDAQTVPQTECFIADY